ncbi:hypothetical protein AVEN_77112-1 [Araneus ventricosus]|uniref:Uncharacterized protein n=1 Tax=Araneus ventricosus TaxID=182803 RepID=A0A4Y2QL11_ARAVE|nr:hypothetical protein AVEN_77112-1 [Araneus ventricosus]
MNDKRNNRLKKLLGALGYSPFRPLDKTSLLITANVCGKLKQSNLISESIHTSTKFLFLAGPALASAWPNWKQFLIIGGLASLNDGKWHLKHNLVWVPKMCVLEREKGKNFFSREILFRLLLCRGAMTHITPGKNGDTTLPRC